MMLLTAIGWDLYERTRSSLVLGFVGLVQFLPVILLVFVAGQAADRFDRRGIMRLTLLGLAASSAGLTALAWWHGPVWPYFACILLAGVAQAFQGPARNALVPALVPTELLSQALAISSSAFQFAFLAGPAAAGALLAVTHNAGPVYAIDMVGALVFWAVLHGLPSPPVARSGKATSWSEVFAGLRFVRDNDLMLAAITLDMFAVLLGGAVALLPVFARDVLAIGPQGLGLLMAAQPVGAFFTGLVLSRRDRIRRNGPALLVSVAIFGLATIAFGASRNAWLSGLMLAVAGGADMVSMVIRQRMTTLLTPDAMRGRVSAVHSVFVGTSNELGAFESGLTASWWGPIGSVVIGGMGTLLVVTLVAWRVPRLRALGAVVPADAAPIPPGSALPEAGGASV